MKFLRVLCVLALALCVTASVYAETQSVKVSGDLTVRSIYRDMYDLESTPVENQTAAGVLTGFDSSRQSWIMSVAAIQVDADLTDNVQTVIRILNQRDWDVYGRDNGGTGVLNGATGLYPNGRGHYYANADEFSVMLDLAYVTLKNFVYSPLTVTIGRQDLWFGKGFIVGANQQNPGQTVLNAAAAGTPAIISNNPPLMVPGNLSAPEYTMMNSFDSVKAVLDYDPWTITGIYSKIYEDSVSARDDVNLWGVNVGYKFNNYKAESEAYWFWKQDRSIPVFGQDPKNTSNDVHTIGLRGSLDPIDVVTLAAEGAYQAGTYIGTQLQMAARGRSAWALDVSGELRYFTDKWSWKPKLGVEYVLYSGADPVDSTINTSYVQDDKTYTGWDPMYRGKYDSAIREFVGKFYQTRRYMASIIGAPGSVPSCPDDSRTNESQLIFSGSVQPIESLTLKANYNLFWNLRPYLGDISTHDENKSQGFVGQEIDLQANWDYTEDVSFGILAGWFVPGEVYDYRDNKAAVASDLVGTVKVSF